MVLTDLNALSILKENFSFFLRTSLFFADWFFYLCQIKREKGV